MTTPTIVIDGKVLDTKRYNWQEPGVLAQAEVAVVPGEAFGPSGFLRLSYALGDDALREGMQRRLGDVKAGWGLTPGCAPRDAGLECIHEDR